jgi:hypothetical protein
VNDQNTAPIAFRSGGPSEQTFDVVVPASGFYPMRLVWYERGGGAQAEFASVNRTTGERTLINDPSVPSAIKAYATLNVAGAVVVSSPTVDGEYTVEPDAVFFFGSGRFEVPISGNIQGRIMFDVRAP